MYECKLEAKKPTVTVTGKYLEGTTAPIGVTGQLKVKNKRSGATYAFSSNKSSVVSIDKNGKRREG